MLRVANLGKNLQIFQTIIPRCRRMKMYEKWPPENYPKIWNRYVNIKLLAKSLVFIFWQDFLDSPIIMLTEQKYLNSGWSCLSLYGQGVMIDFENCWKYAYRFTIHRNSNISFFWQKDNLWSSIIKNIFVFVSTCSL